jgi:tetratricopeptide (TPR) repeat protein
MPVVISVESALSRQKMIALRALSTLAYTYSREGKEIQAQRIFEQVLPIQAQMLAENHVDTLDSMNYLGQIYQRRGDYKKAEKLLTRALELRKMVVARENVFLADVERALGHLRFDQHLYDQAESLLRDALSAYEQAGSESWLRYQTQILLGATLVASERYSEAGSLLMSGRRGMLHRKRTVPPYATPLLSNAEELLTVVRRRTTRGTAVNDRKNLSRSGVPQLR